MKILNATSFGKSVAFNCDLISRVEEHVSDNSKCWIFSGSNIAGTVVDMSFLELVGYLKGVQ